MSQREKQNGPTVLEEYEQNNKSSPKTLLLTARTEPTTHIFPASPLTGVHDKAKGGD